MKAKDNSPRSFRSNLVIDSIVNRMNVSRILANGTQTTRGVNRYWYVADVALGDLVFR